MKFGHTFKKIPLSPLAYRFYKAANEVHSVEGVTWFPLPVFCNRLLLLSCRFKKSCIHIFSPCFPVCRHMGSTEWRQVRSVCCNKLPSSTNKLRLYCQEITFDFFLPDAIRALLTPLRPSPSHLNRFSWTGIVMKVLKLGIRVAEISGL